MLRRSQLIVLVVAPLIAPAAGGSDIGRAKPDSRLSEEATHVVQGKVKAVYSAERETRPGYVDTVYVIEVTVARSMKGNGPVASGVLYARCWKSKQRPAGFEGPTGQTAIPQDGERILAYMKRDRDGGYDLLVPQGFSPYAPTAL